MAERVFGVGIVGSSQQFGVAVMRKSTAILSNLKSKLPLMGLGRWGNSAHFHTNTPTQFNRNRIPHLDHNHNQILTSSSFVARRFESNIAQDHLNSTCGSHENLNQALDFPGGTVMFTPELSFISDSPEERIPCYRVLDDNGQPISGNNFGQVNEEVALKIYQDMVTLQTMDTLFYEAQRQGRISFYATTIGEEAINIASAAALTLNDIVFPQYREPGVLLWRGFTLQEFANQCFSNKFDNGKGRQMPIHYGSNKHNYFTVASTVATQVSHAVGAAYSLKMDGKDACAVTYFGDGGSSEGDVHAALNFAAVLEAPVIFICRNNGWAISTPTSDQFRSDGVVVKGQAYGVRSIRVDGNDALAIYSAVCTARQMAVNEKRPILIEALTYRAGHHSTSDDSTKYRPATEIEWWRLARDPVARFRKWIESNCWWNDKADLELRSSIRLQLLHAIQVAEKVEKPPIADIFTDVYDTPPSNLREQEQWIKDSIKQHPGEYPPNFSV
ncbi:hypothetical protein L6164_012240 [Bauhinia variegata]|uniref:Uncharacterized protein n=1 Tax=Bauhinia variegata TaxID=167791 RepID=A0ACB9P9G8_BAUVA|nr:hypothetical protein L6164_012240 [Bauhinia variegata]